MSNSTKPKRDTSQCCRNCLHYLDIGECCALDDTKRIASEHAYMAWCDGWEANSATRARILREVESDIQASELSANTKAVLFDVIEHERARK